MSAPDPRLLAAALSERDERPWRYYHLEREDLIRGLDARVDRLGQLESALAEKEAALAAAHEVVGDLVAIVAEYAPGFEPDLERASAALSAPALQSAAKLNRLRREVVAALAQTPEWREPMYIDGTEHCPLCLELGAGSGRGAHTESCPYALLAALRAQEEKP